MGGISLTLAIVDFVEVLEHVSIPVSHVRIVSFIVRRDDCVSLRMDDYCEMWANTGCRVMKSQRRCLLTLFTGSGSGSG